MIWYCIVSTIIAAAGISGWLYLYIKGGLLDRLLIRRGLKKRKVNRPPMAISWERCLKYMNCRADVVFFGDSLTSAGAFHEQFPDVKIVNLGSSGEGLASMLGRVSTVQALSPKKVFLLGGINGLTDHNVPCCLSQYEDLLNALQEALPETQLYVQSVLPITKVRSRTLCKNTTIQTFNAGIKALAERHGVTYIDLHGLYFRGGEMDPDCVKDGLHLTPEAYAPWYQTLKQHLTF